MRISDWSSDVCSSDLLDDGEDGRMLDQRGGTFRASEQPPEPLGRRAVETALAKRSARERAGKIGLERGDRLGRKRIGNNAPSFAQEVHGPVCLGLIGGAEIGRAPVRERGCPYVYIPVGARTLHKKSIY